MASDERIGQQAAEIGGTGIDIFLGQQAAEIAAGGIDVRLGQCGLEVAVVFVPNGTTAPIYAVNACGQSNTLLLTYNNPNLC